MKKLVSALAALALLCLGTCTPAMAQNSVASFDWCVATTRDCASEGCNRSTPDKAIKLTAGARKELVAQAGALLAAGHITQAQHDAELQRIKLMTPASGQDYIPWTLWAKPYGS